MTDPVTEAKASFQRWNDAFNSRDTDAQIANMHFPHRRLAGDNSFQVWETANDFREQEDNTTKRLQAEGWDHTATLSITAIQEAPQKVHLAIRQSRQHADGTEYNGFDTLWIFTEIDGRWAVQFRSSFLDQRIGHPKKNLDDGS